MAERFVYTLLWMGRFQLLILAAGDGKKKKIPNAFLLWLSVLSLLRMLCAFWGKEGLLIFAVSLIVKTSVGCALIGLPFLASAAVRPGCIGGGDVKTAFVIGLWLSSGETVLMFQTLPALLIALLIGAAVFGRRGQKEALGPFLCGGVLLAELVFLAFS